MPTLKKQHHFLIFQKFLVRLTVLEKYLLSSKTPAIYVTDVTLLFNEMFHWMFFGLNVNVSQCSVDCIGIIVEPCQSNNMEYLMEQPKIIIYNSSFGNLDLRPGIKAQITQCYIDGEFKNRPTLVTANNLDLSIQNCHFSNFINEKNSTILYGSSNSHVTIENSIFTQHNSSKGVLFFQNNSYMHISSSRFSQNDAFTLGYSAITLQDGIYAAVNSTMFNNNTALIGGVMYVLGHCLVTLNNCAFSSNKAIIGKTGNIPKAPNVEMAASSRDINKTFASMGPTMFNLTPESFEEKKLKVSKRLTRCHLDPRNIRTFAHVNPTLYNQTSLHRQTPEVLLAKTMNISLNSTVHPLDKKNIRTLFNQTSSAAKEPEANTADQTHSMTNNSVLGNIVQKEGYAPGLGGALLVVSYSKLLLTNCVFVDNSADNSAGAIIAGLNVTLDIQGTTFVGNTAINEGGAIEVEQQALLRVKNCTFKDNHSEWNGGAICGGHDVVLEIHDTSFTGNSAPDGGAINIQHQGYLGATDCTFVNNHAEQIGGAIAGGRDAILDLQQTNFTGNKASQSGVIDIQQQGYLHATDCIFVNNNAEQTGGVIGGAYDIVLDIQDTNFTGNNAVEGGAINVQQQVNLSLTKCRLDHNFASDGPGAILVMINVTLEIRETNFTGNSASRIGGALWISQSNCHAVQSVFHSNTAETTGGAMYVGSNSSLQIQNTNFTNNNGSDGGAIYIGANSKLQTKMCVFWENFAVQSGGAIKLNDFSTAVTESCCFLSNNALNGPGGALVVNNPEYASIRNTFFLRNEASGEGGAIEINGGTVTIDNITCVGNHAAGFGGCLEIDSATLTLNNSYIGENVAEHQNGAGVSGLHSRIQVGLLF